MRFREMGNKEIVNVNYGSRLGVLGQTDLEIDLNNGTVNALIIPSFKWFGFKREEEEVTIKWSQIETIGEDMILIRDI